MLGMPIGLGMQPIMPGVGYRKLAISLRSEFGSLMSITEPLGHGISSLANTLDNQVRSECLIIDRDINVYVLCYRTTLSVTTRPATLRFAITLAWQNTTNNPLQDRAVANVEGLRGSALNKIDGLVGMNSMNLANPMLGNPALEMMHQPMLTSRTMGGRPMPVNGRMI